MKVLQGLEPKNVFEVFEAISAIPHGSGNTEAIAKFCCEYGKSRGFDSVIDKGGNVIIKKPATAGYEKAAPVIIQGHFDMVTEKVAGCDIDFTKDGLRLLVDGDWITADGTTLGGDDGIAVAIGLALLDDETAEHPALEILLTRDEETGMYGAIDLEGDKLQGRRLINIDSEIEGVFTVSCAGGVNVDCELKTEKEPVTGEVISIVIDGLTGGHSGVEIHHGRANAYVLLGCVLKELKCRIVSIGGGGKHNAIARRAEAVVCVEGNWKQILQDAEKAYKSRYQETDPELKFTVTPANADFAMTQECSGKVLDILSQVPDGVQKMSEDIEGLVQTSVNRGVIEATADCFNAAFSIRSSVGEERDALARRIIDLVEEKGGKAEPTNGYPAWEYCKDSPLRDLMVETFTELYDKKPEVVAIHAGLECGILAGKLPGLESVSIGPDMKDIHTPDERMSISSVRRVWAFVKEVLKRMK